MSYGFGIGTPTEEPTTATKNTGGTYGFGIGGQDTAQEKESTQPATPLQALTKTLQFNLSGGSMTAAQNVMPGEPNTVVNTGHTNYAGVPAKPGFERDDVLPVSLGGSNQTKENLRYEALLPTGERKPGALTKSDVFLEDQLKQYKTGKQSLGQTRLNVLTFKQQQEGLTPSEKATIQPSLNPIIDRVADTAGTILTNLFAHKVTPKAVEFSGKGPAKPALTFSMSPAVKEDQLTKAATDAAITIQAASERPGDFHPLYPWLVASSLFLGPEFIDAPLATTAKVAVFQGLQTIEEKLNLKLSNLVPEGHQKTKDVLDAIQMLGNGLLSHGIYEQAPTIADAFTKDIITQYKLPTTVKIPGEVIRDIFQTGEKATPEQLEQFTKLTGGDRTKIKAAMANGLDVNVPAQKITALVDKPYWGKIKAALGKDPTLFVWRENAVPGTEPTQAPAGLLEAPKTPFQMVHQQTNPLNIAAELPTENSFGIANEPSTPLQALAAQQASTATATVPPEGTLPVETASGEGTGPTEGARTLPTANEATPGAVPLEKTVDQAMAAEAKTFPTAQAFVDAKVPAHLKDVAPELYTAATEKFNKIYEEATKPKEEAKKPEDIKMARSQMPVGEGKERVSRLEARMKDSLGAIDQDTKEKLGLGTYNQMNKEAQIKAAAKYVAEKPEEALKVLTGEIEAPPGILRNSIFVALQNAGADNVDLARKIASIGSTRLGQELSILTEIDRNSPVNLMSDIVKFREAKFKEKAKRAAEKKGGKEKSPMEAKQETVDAIKDEIKKASPKKQDWASFIEEIKCK